MTEGQFSEHSPAGIKLGFEIMSGVRFKKLNVEHLDRLPASPVILAPSHTTDLDMIAALGVFARRKNMIIAHISGQTMKNDPLTYIGLNLMGKKNFFPIDYAPDRKTTWKQLPFNTDNFDPMIQAAKNGKSVFIAAHNPSYNFELPKRGGYGAVYLAMKTGLPLVPIAVNLHVNPDDIGKNGFSSTPMLAKKYPRPTVDVIVGNPLEVPRLQPEQNELGYLREQTRTVMRTIAEMLPVEKRGVWK